jgi:serine/threonine-protein kinase
VNHPQTLGKFQVTGVLGKGSMGIVYRGWDPDIRRPVALKTIRHGSDPGVAAASHAAARFRIEAQAAGRLLHPGIIGIYDFGTDRDVAFIAMEFVEGHTLASYLAQGACFTDTDIGSIMGQLLDALAHAHDHGVWHRDIKPSNVILTHGGHVKVADFGVARIETSDLTATGALIGTPMYMAPEQFLGQPIDHRVDLYSAGVVLYQLVAGRVPFDGPLATMFDQVTRALPVPPSSLAPRNAADRFDDVVARALAKRPEQRFPAAAQFRRELAAALGGPLAEVVSRRAVMALSISSDLAATELLHRPATAPETGGTPEYWHRDVLQRVEAELARHTGPLAAVLVRRAARACHDLPALYAALATHITHEGDRAAFLLRAAPGDDRYGDPSTLTDALVAQAESVLTAEIGPIARVLVRRAVAATHRRADFYARLLEAVPDTERARVAARLERLN